MTRDLPADPGAPGTAPRQGADPGPRAHATPVQPDSAPFVANPLLFQHLIENSSDIIAVLDADKMVQFVSPSVERLTGYAPEDMLGADGFAPVHPGDQHELDTLFRNLAAHPGKRICAQYRFQHKSGAWRVFETNAVNHLHTPGLQGIVCNTRDITRSNEAEQQLRFTQFAVDHASVAAFWVRPDGRFVYVNRLACEVLGYTREELLNLGVTDINADVPPEQWPQMWDRVKSAGVHTMELHHRKKDGTVFPVEITTNYIRFEGDEYACAFARDISRRRRAEQDKAALQEQLNHMQKMDAIGSLAGGIAHEFNNMLAIILGNAGLLREDLAPGDPGHEELTDILDAGVRARDLSMKLLTFASRDKLTVQNIHISGLLREFTAILERGFPRNIRIQGRAPEDLYVIADLNQLRQALLNLSNNAQDAMPGGGDLFIEAEPLTIRDQDRAQWADLEPGPYCMITVRDTGTGIPESIRDKVFDPFFTTKGLGRGMGLGLSMAHGIARNHGGHIFLHSEPGAGAAVSLCLPAAAGPAQAPLPDRGRFKGTETVLVVDDEPVLLSMARRILERNGYQVFTAGTAAGALELFRKSHACIHLVILDLVLPDRDGEDILEELLAIHPGAAILICSGASQARRSRALLQKGARGFLEKPFTLETLCGAVRNALDA